MQLSAFALFWGKCILVSEVKYIWWQSILYLGKIQQI